MFQTRSFPVSFLILTCMYLYDALQLFHVQPLRLNQFIHYVTVKKDEKYVCIRSYKGQTIK